VSGPALPDVPPTEPPLHQFLLNVKENIELLTGRRGDTLTELDSSATLDDVIEALNQVIARLS
jgi:hypothetical protein